MRVALEPERDVKRRTVALACAVLASCAPAPAKQAGAAPPDTSVRSRAAPTEDASAPLAAGAIEARAEPRNDEGQLACSLFAAADGFPDRAELARARVVATIRGGKAVCRFEGIAAGEYAIAILHDENANGRMDTNWLGMPLEGWGASNDAPPGLVSPPSFEAAKFSYIGGELVLRMRLRY